MPVEDTTPECNGINYFYAHEYESRIWTEHIRDGLSLLPMTRASAGRLRLAAGIIGGSHTHTLGGWCWRWLRPWLRLSARTLTQGLSVWPRLPYDTNPREKKKRPNHLLWPNLRSHTVSLLLDSTSRGNHKILPRLKERGNRLPL